VRGWQAKQKAERSDRQILARLSDGAEVVRYQKAGKLFIEKGDDRQLVLLDAAVKVVKADKDAEIFTGRPGGGAFDRKVAA
jgi:hypothetical protein